MACWYQCRIDCVCVNAHFLAAILALDEIRKWRHRRFGQEHVESQEFPFSREMNNEMISRLITKTLVCLTGLALVFSSSSITVARADVGLNSRLMPLIDAHKGKVAVAVKHLTLGTAFAYHENQPMPTASLIKFPVMAEAYRQAESGKVDLDAMIELAQDDKVPGSGILTPHFSPGTKLSLRDLIHLMIVYSDNTATNLVLDQIGLASTGRTMEKLGFPNTKIHAKVFRQDSSIFPERSKSFGLGSTTASETIRLYELLFKRELVNAQACDEMLEHLYDCDDKNKLARFLPREIKIAHKGGSVSAVRCDAGIIESPGGTFAICVLTSENADRRWTTDNAGNRLCASIAREAYYYFNPKVKQTTAPKVLKLGASGRLVEDLQRTLNARLKPSPELSVDGDFGPVTQAALSRFQKDNDLKSSGIADEPTWQALGTLVTRDRPVPNPDVINSEALERDAIDALQGPPFVTCKAWAIADTKTGKFLWGGDEMQRLDFASTTKIMTAYIVLKLAETKPKVLDEEITFSTRADRTGGSTAGIRAGEILTVRELLYGLMLPSGNDASVALAEHFGARFEPPDANEQEAADSYSHFIAEMNRQAKSLGMEQTTYKNPHGLTARGHVSSARDLLRLAHAAMAVSRFREYVGTRQHGSRLRSTSGYQRNVVWKNTNRLLGIEGYAGVKTGTTSAAGACLVSTSKRGGDQLLLVVLGAKSSDARYIDSRNLYRWAWLQRGHQD